MINTNLKAQVQARIDAITGATTLSELLRIQTQANGLGCNTAPLTAQIEARLTALDSSTPLTDLTIAALLAEGKSDRAYYQVPFSVSAGDKLFINAFGQVKRRVTDAVAVLSAEFPSNITTYTASAIPAGSLVAGTSQSAIAAAITLADGNVMVFRAFRTTTPADYRLRITVTNAAGNTVLSDQTTGFIDGNSGPNVVPSDAQTLRLVAIREQSANVFRVFCTTAPQSGDGFNSQLRYFTMTYNNVNHAVTVSSGAYVLERGTGIQWESSSSVVSQTEQYHLLRDSSNRLYVLNTATSTATQVATLATSVSAVTKSLAGGVWGAALSSGNRLLVRADTATSQALPANLTADGCFASGSRVEILSGRLWIAIVGTLVKLVSFTADYTGCTIYTLGNIETSGNIGTILKDGDTYTVGLEGASVFAFTWTGASAPTDFRPDAGFRMTDRKNFTEPQELPNHFRRVNSSDVIFCTGAVFNGSQSTVRVMVLRVNADQYMAYLPQHFATCLTSAPANGFVEIELAPNTKVSPGATSTYSAKAHQNLLTVLTPRGPRDRVYQASPQDAGINGRMLSSKDLDLLNASVSENPVSLNNAAALLETDNTYVLSAAAFTVMTPIKRIFIPQGGSPGLVSVIDVQTAALFANINSSVSLLAQKVNE